jgi:hypothetical protein
VVGGARAGHGAKHDAHFFQRGHRSSVTGATIDSLLNGQWMSGYRLSPTG